MAHYQHSNWTLADQDYQCGESALAKGECCKPAENRFDIRETVKIITLIKRTKLFLRENRKSKGH